MSKPNKIWRADDIAQLLRATLPPDAYSLFFEVANGTGSSARRHMDAVAMSLWPSRGLDLTAYEIKVSRADWQTELKTPQKAEAVARFCDYMIVCAPKDVVDPDTLPPKWGLMIPTGRGKLKIARKAERLALTPFPESHRGFLASLLRHGGSKTAERVARVTRAECDAVAANDRRELADLRRTQRGAVELRKTLEEFESASGLSIGRYGVEGKRIGSAVAAVLAMERPEQAILGLSNTVQAALRRAESAAERLRELARQLEGPEGLQQDGIRKVV